jgi:LPXTG-site transpeptidase (sortase) family protein
MLIKRLYFITLLLALVATGLGSSTARALPLTSTVQFTMPLNADVVINRTGGTTDNTQIGVDGDGGNNYCYLTQTAAANYNGNPNGIPDNGFIAANTFHPDVQLSVNNGNNGNNSYRFAATGSFNINVPDGNYSYVHIFGTTGNGTATFRLTLNYSDGSVNTSSVTLQDWYDDFQGAPGGGAGATIPATESADHYYLINGLDRMRCNVSGYQDANDPAIFGHRFATDISRTLQSVDVVLTGRSSNNARAVFFGAVGESNDPPSITSDGGGATASVNAAENQTAVTDVNASDDGQPTPPAALTYSIIGGADQLLFNIGSTSGILTFVSAPDFENPTDVGADNVYDVTVQVSDSILTDTQAIAVTVTNVDEVAPVVIVDSVSPDPTNTDTTITWHADENGTYSVRVNGTNCTDGTEVDNGAYATSPATITSNVPAASLAAGANTLRVCVTDTDANTGSAIDTVIFNTDAPQVMSNGVNSVPDTGDGILVEGETATVGITQLLITFSEDMNDSTAGDEVTNAANYLLLSEGSVAGFQTASCAVAKTGAGVDPGDTQIAITSVTYNSSTFTATLNLVSALPDGIYRLYACGTATLRDLAGNALGGGTDFIRNFQVQLATGGGGGGGGTGGGGNAAATSSAGQIPVTGFAPGRITDLSGMPITSYHATNGVTLEVPVLKLKLPIVGVPMQNKSWDVNWLLNQAGWLEGTAFPGYAGNSVLTSHVTLSYGQAGPFANLYKLKAGDKIFVHAFGDLHIYEVKSVQKLDATDASILKHEDKSWLTLVTCADYNEKAETYLKRLVVKAVLVQTQVDQTSGR